jgi:hypothetical protein
LAGNYLDLASGTEADKTYARGLLGNGHELIRAQFRDDGKPAPPESHYLRLVYSFAKGRAESEGKNGVKDICQNAIQSIPHDGLKGDEDLKLIVDEIDRMEGNTNNPPAMNRPPEK